MNEVYVVISITDNSVTDVCEVYSDKQQAFGRAAALAHFAAVHHPEWNTSPRARTDTLGNTHWIFLRTPKLFSPATIAVYCKPVIGSNVKSDYLDNTKTLQSDEEILKSAFSDISGSINYNSLITQLGARDPEEFLAGVLDNPNLLNWQRMSATALLEHWATHKKITISTLGKHWKYSVSALAHDPDDFYRLIDFVIFVGDYESLKFISNQIDKLYQSGSPTEKYWASRVDKTRFQVQVSALLDDPMDPSLPAGWDYSGKPITMADLLNNPYNVQLTYELSDAQNWALVTSRISKRSNFTVYLQGAGNCNQAAALQALKTKSGIGEEIVQLECSWLDRIISEKRGEDEDSSSEESSEDY